MAPGPSVAVLRDIQSLFDTGTVSGFSDRQLLERFAGRRDASAEAAFEVLVLRHGPMVLRVCRNVLGDSTDAEDAFQATFVVLVRRCGSIRRLESLGSWLYGVACRVAARARVDAAKRRSAERGAALRVVQTVDASGAGEQDRAEYGTLIQEEVRRLPEKHRAVVALCYWQGLTQEQAAVQLGCPLGTVRSRLARARNRLHRQLTRRGLAPLAGSVAAALDAPSVEAARLSLVPNPLIRSTVTASVQILAGRAVSDVVSTSVFALTQSVLRRMLMMKLGTVAVSLAFFGLGAYGVSLAAPQAEPAKSPPTSRRVARVPAEQSQSKVQPRRVSLEDYVVDPPDILLVEVLEAIPGRPISGERLVRPDGKISLGFYGDIYVAGLTVPEVKEKVVRHLQKYLEDRALGLIPIDNATGEPKVDPASKKPIMIDPKDSATVFVDVKAYNSKFFYVQGEVLVSGRLPIKGKETILDAINMAGGLGPQANHTGVVLYRQDPSGRGLLEPLRVDIDQIMMGDDLSTNYQLQPGDRLAVPRIPNSRSDGREAEVRQPIQEPAVRFDSSAALLRVEQRLSDVERKLDKLIEALKSRTP
jgi:polysaccharide biosynthesis/export protein